jgi:hypothetical protein
MADYEGLAKLAILIIIILFLLTLLFKFWSWIGVLKSLKEWLLGT